MHSSCSVYAGHRQHRQLNIMMSRRPKRLHARKKHDMQPCHRQPGAGARGYHFQDLSQGNLGTCTSPIIIGHQSQPSQLYAIIKRQNASLDYKTLSAIRSCRDHSRAVTSSLYCFCVWRETWTARAPLISHNNKRGLFDPAAYFYCFASQSHSHPMIVCVYVCAFVGAA